VCSSAFAAEPVQRLEVHGVKALPDTEQKDADEMNAIRTEKATLISTTRGIPRAPVPARMSPFSSDMNPIT
jgi:hypothetical protein